MVLLVSFMIGLIHSRKTVLKKRVKQKTVCYFLKKLKNPMTRFISTPSQPKPIYLISEE